jgi:hypothetical protein
VLSHDVKDELKEVSKPPVEQNNDSDQKKRFWPKIFMKEKQKKKSKKGKKLKEMAVLS